jgi:hypothetical protein
LLNDKNKTFFRIGSLPYNDNNGVHLIYLANDNFGMKMTGDFPTLWATENKNTGPYLYDDNYTYHVVSVDYRQKYIWLEQI